MHSNKLIINPKTPNDLINFSADIQFDPFPSTIDITNPYICTGSELKECEINNNLSCIGCQSLIARCIHFEKDTKYFDANNVEHLIPKNDDPNKGYCLTTTNDLNLRCNVYHGDLALIQLSPESSETMAFCNCRAPGLIGNTTLLGACDTPFLCNGNVQDINKPLEEIECNCSKFETNTRLLDIPTCRSMTVQEASNNGLLNDVVISNPKDLLPIRYFNDTIQNNINVKNLLNPCNKCPITNQDIPNYDIGDLHGTKFCTITTNSKSLNRSNEYFGIPFRRSQSDRILSGSEGPDAILGAYWYQLLIYTRLENFIQRLVYFITYENNKEIYNLLNLDPSSDYGIGTDDSMLGVHILPPIIDSEKAPRSACWDTTFGYACSWGLHQDVDDILRIQSDSMFQNQDRFYTSPFQHISHQPRNSFWAPGPFREMTALNRWSRTVFLQDNDIFTSYLTISDQFFRGRNKYASSVSAIAWGYRRIDKNPESGWEIIIQNNNNVEDWERVQAAMTAPN